MNEDYKATPHETDSCGENADLSNGPVQLPKSHEKGKRLLKTVIWTLAAIAVLGTAFGIGWLLKDSINNHTVVHVSDRPLTEVETVKVDGAQMLTNSEIYASNVGSCVSINVSSTVGMNIFGQPVKTASSGSGFVITEDGYIVTNYHVIDGGEEVMVTFHDGTTYPTVVVGGYEEYDIAVIKIQADKDIKFQPVVLGTTEDLHVGDDVVAIGNPLGELTFSMSEGIASCLNREINVGGIPFNMIQITAAVNGGNSGGPLFNTYGEVIGIVSAKYSTSGNGASVEGLGFAIPIDDVWDMIVDIMEYGQVTSRPYLGVQLADAVRVPKLGLQAGACIVEVSPDGPAAQAGLQVNDVIAMIDSTIINNTQDVKNTLGNKSYRAGDIVAVTYVRNGQVATTEVTLGSSAEIE